MDDAVEKYENGFNELITMIFYRWAAAECKVKSWCKVQSARVGCHKCAKSCQNREKDGKYSLRFPTGTRCAGLNQQVRSLS